MSRILILGTIPPPIGGVTIHVERSIDLFKLNNINYRFLHLRKTSNFKLLHNICLHKFIHIHSSNVFYRFFVSVFCFITRKKLLITYHGDVGRYDYFKNTLDILSIYFAYIPIVLNDKSYKIASRINRKAKLVSAFLPPTTIVPLPSDLLTLLSEDKKGYKYTFTTNAYNLSFDKYNHETYGIKQLISLFNEFPEYRLYISDPSCNYSKYLIKEKIHISSNIKFISFPHNYFELLKYTDCFIRNTSTDGDSISVKEALYLNKIVLASDIVSRPMQVYTYGTINELKSLISDFASLRVRKNEVLSAENSIKEIYNSLIKGNTPFWN